MPSPLVRGLKRRASVAAGSSGRPTASSPTVRDRPRDPGSAQCSTAQGRPRARARTAGSHAASGIVDEEVISSSRGAGAGMNRTVSRVVMLAGVGAGVLVARRMTTRQVGDGAARIAPDRWHTVTVNRPPEEVAPEGRLPEPLAGLSDAVEVRFRPAPGGRGTELAARLRDDAPAGPGGAVGQDRREGPAPGAAGGSAAGPAAAGDRRGAHPRRAADGQADAAQPAAGAGDPAGPRRGTTVKALVWEGVNELSVEQVPDPRLLNRQDAILKVNLSSV